MLNPEIVESTEPLLNGNVRDSKLQLPFNTLNENANSYVIMSLIFYLTSNDEIDIILCFIFRNLIKRYKS